MAQLTYFFASMNAGKSAHLLQANYNYVQIGMRTLLMTSALDDRFGANRIASGIGLSAPAIGISPDDNILEHFRHELSLGRIDCVMMDEVQFLTRDQVDQLSDIVDAYDVPVKCYGLRNDFLGEPFDGSLRLMSIADVLTTITSVCFCGSPANMVVRTDGDHRVLTSGDQVAIESTGEASQVRFRYHSVCRKHFKSAMKSEFYPHPMRPDRFPATVSA